MAAVSGVRLEFTCPRCGSRYYGSSEGRPGTLWRWCHGRSATGVVCTFRFSLLDDWRHFTLDGKKYDSRKSYERALARALARVNRHPPTARGPLR